MKNINEKIRKVRELKGLTQQDMADRLHMSQNNYSKMELGHVNIPTARLKEIAEILEMSPQKIIAFDADQILNANDLPTYLPKENSCHEVVERFAKKLEEVYQRENNQLKEEIQFLRKLLEMKNRQ